MSHTYVSSFFHVVFSTKERRPQISDELQPRLWAYIGGIARQNNFTAIAVGGTSDHVHILRSLPSTMPISKAVQLIKGGSSKWIHDTFSTLRKFSWQQGYGAFSISVSDIERTIKYIENQKRHHAKKDFREEFVQFLRKHNIPYDERFVFG